MQNISLRVNRSIIDQDQCCVALTTVFNFISNLTFSYIFRTGLPEPPGAAVFGWSRSRFFGPAPAPATAPTPTPMRRSKNRSRNLSGAGAGAENFTNGRLRQP